MQKANKSFLKVFGQDDIYPIAMNQNVDIVTLQNNNVMQGTVTQRDQNTVKLIRSDGQETFFLPQEVKAITSINLMDTAPSTDGPTAKPFTSRDTRIEFLTKIQYDSFKYFLNEVNKFNGLVKDSSTPNSPLWHWHCRLGFKRLLYCCFA